MKNNVLSLTVALVVGVILVGSLVAPTITAMTDETRTYYNDGTPFVLADSEDTDTHTLVLGSDDDGNIAITLDDVACEVPDFTLYSAATVVYCEDTFVRLTSAGGVYLYGANGSATYGSVSLGNCLSADITFEITGTTMTVSTYTVSNVKAYISDEGTYRLCANPYVLEDTTVYVGAYTSLSGVSIGVVVYGALDDLTAKAVVPGGRSVDTPEVNLTDITSTGLKQLESIEVDCYNSSTLMGTMTINYLLAPYEIVYDNPNYVGSALVPIMLSIIVITILALVMMAARAVTRE